MNNFHQKLTQKYPKYHNWHQTKHHNKIHWGVLVVFTFLVFTLLSANYSISLAADTVPPTTPINLTATPISSSQINLSWTASTDDTGVTGYKIYRCAGSACAPTTQIVTSAVNSYSNTGLTASTVYTYAVSAYDAAGNESGKSAPVSTETNASETISLVHPRIFITPSMLPELRCKAGISDIGACANFGSNSSQYVLMKQKADWLLTQSITSDTASIPVLAMTYLLTGNTVYSTNAISRLVYFVDNVSVWYQGVDASEGDVQSMLFWMMRVALSYDWIHDQLTQGVGSQEEKIANFIANYSNPIRWTSRQFTDWSNLAMLAYGTPLLHGLAIYNDGVNDTVAQNIIDVANTRLNTRYLPARSLVAGQSGGFSEGFIYATYADAYPLSWVLEGWRTATNEDKFVNFTPLKELAKWYLYFSRPYDGTWERMQEGREYMFINTDNREARRYFTLLASKYNDGYAQYIAEQSPYSGYTSYNTNDVWTDILWYNTAIAQTPPTTFSQTSKLFGTIGFGGQPGLGWSIFRSGFGSLSDVFATFIAGDHYGAHWLRLQNSFTIHKYNSLAIHGGYYAQWDSVGDTHKIKYYYPMGGNTMVFTNDSGATVSQYDWGGDSWESRKTYSTTVSEDQHDTADMLKFEDNVKYSYALGDASIAYNGGTSSGGDKNIQKFQREFVYIKPDYFVIFDRVTSKSTYKKRWMLHSVADPQINGTFTGGIAPNAFGGTPGQTSSNTNIVTITNGSGKLFSKTLLPQTSIVTKIGGPDTAGNYNTSGSYDFYIDGVNYPTGGSMTSGSEPGVWRVEISPSTLQNSDNFLHVLYPTDATTISMPSTIKIDASSGNMVGALIQDPMNPYIVMFSKTETPQSSVTYDANYSSSLTGKHLLADMSPGTYDIYKNSTKILNGLTASSQGTLYFESTGGSTFQIVKTGEAPSPADTTAPTIPTNLTATPISSSQINLSWTASTDNVGVAGYKIYRDGTQVASATSISYSDTGLQPSTTYSYTVSAYDAAGNNSNQSASASATTQALPDTTPPTGTVSINAGAAYLKSTSATLTLSATDSGSGMGAGSQMQFSNDNTTWSAAEAYSASKAWILSAGDGLKTVYAKYKDVAGNWMTTAVSGTIILDATLPILSISAPTTGSAVSGASVIISADASDNVGVAGVQFQLDGTNLGAEDTASPYAITWDTTTTTNSAHTLTAIAKDNAGNSATSSAVNITVNNILPDTQAPTTPTGLTVVAVSSSQINLSWTASTDDVGVTGYKIYRCAGSACAPTVQIATSPTNSYSDTGLTASTAYTYAVSAYDVAGNESGKSVIASAVTPSPPIQYKPSDLNQDTKVNSLDFEILKLDWNKTTKPISDLNQDGIVDSRDLGIMMSSWEN